MQAGYLSCAMQTTPNSDTQQIPCQQTWQSGAFGYASVADTNSNIASSSIAPTAFNISADASSSDSFSYALMEHFSTQPQDWLDEGHMTPLCDLLNLHAICMPLCIVQIKCSAFMRDQCAKKVQRDTLTDQAVLCSCQHTTKLVQKVCD